MYYNRYCLREMGNVIKLSKVNLFLFNSVCNIVCLKLSARQQQKLFSLYSGDFIKQILLQTKLFSTSGWLPSSVFRGIPTTIGSNANQISCFCSGRPFV